MWHRCKRKCKQRYLRIQGRMQIFERSALNRVLTSASECRRKILQIPLRILDLGVELRPIYCSKRVPYIPSLDIHRLRIQGRMQMFERSVFNRVLTLARECRSQMQQIPLIPIDLGAFCVELLQIYCSKIILVPMSYILW